MNHVTAPGRQPPQPGQDTEEPEQGMEDDIPAEDHDPDGTQPGPDARSGAHAHDGDEVQRHGDA